MKLVTSLLGAVVLLGLVGFYYQHQQSTILQSQLTDLAHEREYTRTEFEKINARLVELQNRIAAVSTAVARVATTTAASSSEGARSGAGAAAVAPAAPVARPGVTVTAPTGWGKNGAKPENYVVGVDSTNSWGGMPSAYVESLSPTVAGGFGGMMQTTAADDYTGKRVRLSGWVKTADANEGGGHLWLRIDGQERGQMLGFDNMDNRPVKGTSDWQESSIVLDVPANAQALAYGFFVSGGGKMWVNGQRIEIVGQDVPTTNMIKRKPENLGFAPGTGK